MFRARRSMRAPVSSAIRTGWGSVSNPRDTSFWSPQRIGNTGGSRDRFFAGRTLGRVGRTGGRPIGVLRLAQSGSDPPSRRREVTGLLRGRESAGVLRRGTIPDREVETPLNQPCELPRAGVDVKYAVVPLPLDEANAFVQQHHRHHGRVVGHKFSLGVSDREGSIRGVAIIGRPVSRILDDGLTLEVTRLATDGSKDACSALYGACRRAAFALGYKRLVTYTLASESGISLRASGYRLIGEAGGGSWSVPSRPRVDKHPLEMKFKWEVTS